MARDYIYQSIIGDIISGTLKAGEKIVEATLAKKYSVSRTPLRQVLFELVSDKFLIYVANKGFSVPELSAVEVSELYSVIKALEVEALRDGFELLSSRVELLNGVNESFISEEAPKSALEFDQQFHDIITSSSSNKTLKEMLELTKLRAKRYDLIFFHNQEFISHSYHQHTRIITSIKTRDLTTAIAELEANWVFGQKYFLNKYQEG